MQFSPLFEIVPSSNEKKSPLGGKDVPRSLALLTRSKEPPKILPRDLVASQSRWLPNYAFDLRGISHDMHFLVIYIFPQVVSLIKRFITIRVHHQRL